MHAYLGFDSLVVKLQTIRSPASGEIRLLRSSLYATNLIVSGLKLKRLVVERSMHERWRKVPPPKYVAKESLADF